MTASGEVLKTPVWADAPPSDLDVEINGQLAAPVAVSDSDSHLILLLVLDAVSRPDRVDAAREAVISKLTELGRKVHAGVLSAQDGLSVVQPPIRSRKRLREKLESVAVRGVPGLLDVVGQVSRLADETLGAADIRLAVLFLTDGQIEDYRGDYTLPVVNPSDSRDLSRRFRGQLIRERIRSVAGSLESSQAPIFFLHLVRRYDDLNEVYQNGISEFARMTGGLALFARAVQDVPVMVEQLLDEIAAHVVLSLEVACDGPLRLEVMADDAGARHKELLRCPRPDS